MFVVQATIRGVGPILCARPYPRRDHLEPHGYDQKEEAEAFASELQERFPEAKYEVVPHVPLNL